MSKPRTALADTILAIEGSRRTTNDRGNSVTTAFVEDISRDTFDSRIYRGGKGWQRWDTSHDFQYFGVWVHRGLRQVLTMAEGDIALVQCPDDERFAAELGSMEKLYGAPPPVAIGIDADGSVTKYFSPRLTAASLCLSLMVGLAGGCRSTAPTRQPEPAEITEITCGRSCLVGQAGPSTVVWID